VGLFDFKPTLRFTRRLALGVIVSVAGYVMNLRREGGGDR
jgi:hypothetical protein